MLPEMWVEAATSLPRSVRHPSTATWIVTKIRMRADHEIAHVERRTEVRCPRVTLAAMIAAASFGLRRSGTFANGNTGSGLLGRISEAWPALAPPGECSDPSHFRFCRRILRWR